MQDQITQTNWQPSLNARHWLKHLLLPVGLITGVLFLPKPWTTELLNTQQVIEIELFKSKTEPAQAPIETKPETAPPEPIIEPVEKPQDPPPIEKPTNQPAEQATQAPKKTSVEQQSIERPPQVQISAGDVLNMMQNRQSIEITAEFQARTTPAKDFYIPTQQITDWYADIPFLDESVDKPQLPMRFYPEGIEGQIEKFFDKVTYRKTFTTKYGTKIDCALIAGVLAACGWK